MALQIGVVCAATFGAEQVIAWLGFEASYTDRPVVLRWMAFFFGFPALFWVMGSLARFQVELEMAREERERELEASRVDPVSLEPFDDLAAISPRRDSRSRLVEDRRRRDGGGW